MKKNIRIFSGSLIVIVLLVAGIWFATGLPKTFLLQGLSNTPGLLVYADETTATEGYRKWTSFVESCPLPEGIRKFFLQYCEAGTSSVVVRSLHPSISVEEFEKLKGLEIVNFLDIHAGADADKIIDLIVNRAPNLRILHLHGAVTAEGLKNICLGLSKLEDLYLAAAVINGAVPELEQNLVKLQGLTFENCELALEFRETLDRRPDVKIVHLNLGDQGEEIDPPEF